MKNFILFIIVSFFANFSWSQCEDFEMTYILQNPTCHDFSDGSISILTTGGTAPIEYSIIDSTGAELTPGPGGTANILQAGCYFIEVVDATGCMLTDSVCLINPDPITVDLVITDPTFPGACDGIVLADTVYGYQGAYESISYYWTIPGAGLGKEVMDVCAGEYDLTINDEYGCSGSFHFALGSLAEIPMNATEEIKVISNRLDGNLSVQGDFVNGLNIRLLNLAGQVVFDAVISSENSVYTPNLKQGVYLYTIGTSQELIQTGKLIF